LLLQEWGSGRSEALQQLLPLAYDRLRNIAGGIMRTYPHQTLQPTALVSELYLRLSGQSRPELQDRDHFYRFCARAMRWILSDHVRERMAEKKRIEMTIPKLAEMPWLGERQADILSLDMALDKLEALDSRKLSVLELRLFLGASAAETAELLGISKATVDRELRLTRAWLYRELRQ
jgi:RNA polymerase sigma factor (TIGR02999 family)